MLLSHSHRFVYLKTNKTGGTSVEIYFEPYCIDNDPKSPISHYREAAVSSSGIVGARGYTGETWFNHMPALRVRELLGESVWCKYHKFCVIRNPFDKVVSQFWFSLPPTVRELLGSADFPVVRRAFLSSLETLHLPRDYAVCTLDGQLAVDSVIRFESLHHDLQQVCQRLSVPWDPTRLGRYKSGYRIRKEHFSEYYTPAGTSIVQRAFSKELRLFGYPEIPNRESFPSPVGSQPQAIPR